MFITRTISGAVLLIIMFAAIFAGGNVWLVTTAVLSAAAMYEMFRVFKIQKSAVAAGGYICNVLVYCLLFFGLYEYILAAVILYFIFVMTIYVVKWPAFDVNTIARALFTFIYTGICLSFLYRIRVSDDGIFYIWLVFIGAWGSDTCAYLTGILIGKHKIPSTLSPKKTVEGCLGGIAGAAVIGMLYGLWAGNRLEGSAYYVLIFAVTAAVASVLSQIGDLCASAVKRNCGIKDYGRLIPGHGGIMDRFDSIIFLTPIIYYILYILQNIGCI
ncbi:MAG: phosphatidate cytidylyltransferase [Lachnospiraceae bacterium]|nr:phosphatidate cytidylyltransferase [Lachnospiraceae bacterium]